MNDNDSPNSKKQITVIHCWSAPRSRSTALLYSFEARGSSCVAIDEPLYRSWLLGKGDAVERPYLQAMIDGKPPKEEPCGEGGISNATHSASAFQWRRELRTLEERLRLAAESLPDGGVIFCKHMAKHSFLYDFDNNKSLASVTVTDKTTKPADESPQDDCRNTPYTLSHRHMLLIRDPVAVLSSWGCSSSVHGNNPTPDEVGIVPLLAIYSQVTSVRNSQSVTQTSHNKVVLLDSDELVQNPQQVLRAACLDLNIPFLDNMMEWKAGPHECDGPWAAWWYHDVWRSTGWKQSQSIPNYAGNDGRGEPPRKRYRTMNPVLMDALRASMPAYEFLKTLTRGYLTRGPNGTSPSLLYEDPRNEHLLVWVGPPTHGRLVPREAAGVSPWDSAVQGGDAAWEGLRVYRHRILHLEKHLRRLFDSAKALGFDPALMHTKAQVVDAIFQTLAANGMRDGAHIRLTLTRGEKVTSSMNPKFNVYGTTLIVLAEWKPTEGATTYDNTKGVSLITASQRRNSPQTVDSKIHHNNLINNILPKIQANLAGAADAIMLDLDGFVSETNATNLFMVRYKDHSAATDTDTALDRAELVTPHADHCLPGITRATVMELSTELGIPCVERRVSLAEFHAADEVFTSGTMGELTPVTMIDGRVIGHGVRGPVTAKLQEIYRRLPERDGYSTPLPEFEDASVA